MDLITAAATIVATACIMILRDWRDGKSLFKRNGNGTPHELMVYLKQHYNDELSDKLKEHGDTLKEIRDFSRDSLTELKNLKENGIKCKE